MRLAIEPWDGSGTILVQVRTTNCISRITVPIRFPLLSYSLAEITTTKLPSKVGVNVNNPVVWLIVIP